MHHIAREVFATQDELSEDFGVVHGPATVCSPAEWPEHEHAGDDVYLCDYEYDSLCWVRPELMIIVCCLRHPHDSHPERWSEEGRTQVRFAGPLWSVGSGPKPTCVGDAACGQLIARQQPNSAPGLDGASIASGMQLVNQLSSWQKLPVAEPSPEPSAQASGTHISCPH